MDFAGSFTFVSFFFFYFFLFFILFYFILFFFTSLQYKDTSLHFFYFCLPDDLCWADETNLIAFSKKLQTSVM